MRRTRPSAVVLRHLSTASTAADAGAGGGHLHVVAGPRRHGLDALEVDEQVDGADDRTQ